MDLLKETPDVILDEGKESQLLKFLNYGTPSTKSAVHTQTIDAVEQLVFRILSELSSKGCADFLLIDSTKWESTVFTEDQTLTLNLNNENSCQRRVCSKQKQSRHRFALIVYTLSEVHRLLSTGGCCTTRELYYRDPALTLNQTNVEHAVQDVSGILRVNPWKLGVLTSGKGIVAGALTMVLMNGDVIDCRSYNGATLIPNDFSAVDFLETSATYVLLVEKETVFENLLSCDILSKANIVLVSGKGYPDVSTRMLVHELSFKCKLPIYALFDADPYGVEIMLIYRHGSRAMSSAALNLACPRIKWLGVHPSELRLMPTIQRLPLTERELKKLDQLLSRSYIAKVVRKELQVMAQMRQKSEIESLYNIAEDFLFDDYIINKIRRQLFI